MKPHWLIAVFCLAPVLSLFAAAEIVPLPEKISPAISDRQIPSAPDQVHLGGLLGERVLGNEANRLRNVDTARLLEGYVKRPGRQSWDGEHVGKWLHAATLAWVNTGDPQLRRKLDETAAALCACQLEDGYLGTYLPKDRWTEWDVWAHKYNLIGLLTYIRWTGNQAPLPTCRRMADLLCKTFGPNQGQLDIVATGYHVGMASTSVLEPMVLLYRFTGEKRYLDFCQYLVKAWEQPNGPQIVSRLLAHAGIDHVGNGKAYEMLSCLNGALELYRTTGEPSLLNAPLIAWQDIVESRLYVTGTTSYYEHFHAPYDLPNQSDVAETCVSVTWLQLNAQLLRLTGEARFADQIERTVLNQLLGAQRPDCTGWGYYVELAGKKPYSSTLDANCCLSSGPRGVALIPTLAMMTEPDGFSVNLYSAGDTNVRLPNGLGIKVSTTTSYPENGDIRLTLSPKRESEFSVRLLIPSWCEDPSLRINGQPSAIQRGADGYAVLRRVWSTSDTIDLALPVRLRVIAGDHSNLGKAALARGPLILAADSARLANPADFDRIEIPTTNPKELAGRLSFTPVPFAEAGGTGGKYNVWLPLARPPVQAVKHPPTFAALRELPLTQIHPEGWLKKFLETQRDGLTGHLENAGYPFNTVGWAADSIPDNHSIEDWWPYEQNAYWVDGMIRTGLLLRDDFLVAKARRSIDYVIKHPRANGFLGPVTTPTIDEMNRWIHVVFFRALMADYAENQDENIPRAMERHYLGLKNDYADPRRSLNIEPILWTYSHTGNRALLDLAESIYAQADAGGAKNTTSAETFENDAPSHEHGVTYNERMKLGALLYSYTGKRSYLDASLAGHRKLERHHMMISGVNVSSEMLEPVSTIEAYENCDISDYTWSSGYLLLATGEAAYADAIERAIFNAGPGSVTTDFKALQYFSAPNQVVATHHSFRRTGDAQMSYSPNPGTECCPANVSRWMPNFASRIWMTNTEGALVAAMYAPSRVTFAAPENGKIVKVDEATSYPFSNDITFTFHCEESVELPFVLRIPVWSATSTLKLNGNDLPTKTSPGTFVTLRRRFVDGDRLTLSLSPQLKFVPGPEDSLSVERGPLVFALRVAEKWQIDPSDARSTKAFPAYDLFPASPWNYALSGTGAELSSRAVVEQHDASDSPWSIETAPIEIKLPARRVPDWKLEHKTEVLTDHWDVLRDPKTQRVTQWLKNGYDKKTGEFTFTPPVPFLTRVDQLSEEETVTLVPYGCTKLRIAYFPHWNAEGDSPADLRR